MAERAPRSEATETNEMAASRTALEDLSHRSGGAPTGGRWLGGGSTFRLDPPHLPTTADSTEERRATWVELDFDLVFAAAIGQLLLRRSHDTLRQWVLSGYRAFQRRLRVGEYRAPAGGASAS